jgi:bifunctional non-homologous end joining protein LigD
MPTAATPSRTGSGALRFRQNERVVVPTDRRDAALRIAGRSVRLTNLRKTYFPEAGITKRDLLQYYADVAGVLIPHLADRAMVMKRYPNGIHEPFFFMKRTPAGAPDWISCCTIEHRSSNVIDFPIVGDVASLLWVVNLGCIDLNPWYARCDDYDRPDFLNFDLDPVPPASFDRVRDVALRIRDALDALGARSFAKTSGSKGIHIYVPIVHGPVQKDVWRFAKRFAQRMEREAPNLITAEYRVAKRPAGRVLVDYNQNAWGRTLASVYSVRPRVAATVSTPVTWEEVEAGVETADFTLANVPARVREVGDLWRPLLHRRGRFDLERHL